eukprot:TRINITY_DN81201_c0_g1_i1.p1 TRINITY_DN81201_c0_g1~~TRINITY_DN81201_c0_g1_i1.p1  ORF type:complete len:113 (-),score=1.66 TRINITY_DN81201_c0_g1_i1:375-713(-)
MKALVILCFFLFPMSVNAETICKVKHFSALPHSFSGAERCKNESEWVSEAIARCKQKASEVYPSVPSVSFSFPEFFAPGYAGSYVMDGTQCKATFSELNCNVDVCRTVDETF